MVLAGAAGSGVLLARSALHSLAAHRNTAAIDHFLADHPIRKLQLGAGGVEMPGWLNTDIDPVGPEVFLDAAKPYPLPDNSIHYIFGEHVVEHVPLAAADVMFNECFRVLAPGGKLRLATPDLNRLAAILEHPNPSYIQQKFGWHRWPMLSPELSAVFIVNQELHNWGHEFVYTEAALRERLSAAGFQPITRFDPGASDDPVLAHVEQRHENPALASANDYESMVLQAVKPAR